MLPRYSLCHVVNNRSRYSVFSSERLGFYSHVVASNIQDFRFVQFAMLRSSPVAHPESLRCLSHVIGVRSEMKMIRIAALFIVAVMQYLQRTVLSVLQYVGDLMGAHGSSCVPKLAIPSFNMDGALPVPAFGWSRLVYSTPESLFGTNDRLEASEVFRDALLRAKNATVWMKTIVGIRQKYFSANLTSSFNLRSNWRSISRFALSLYSVALYAPRRVLVWNQHAAVQALGLRTTSSKVACPALLGLNLFLRAAFALNG